jgi:magnesium transporter
MIDIFYFDKKVKKAQLNDLPKLKNNKVWVDISNASKEDILSIGKIFDLHPLSVEDMVNSNTRIKVEEFPNYLFCVFYGLIKTKDIALKEVDFVLGKNFLITNHSHDSSVFQNLKADTGRLALLFDKGMDFIFHRILDKEIDNFFPILETIDDDIETIEDSVAKKADSKMLQNILKMKRKIIVLKKIAMPQREKVSFIAKNDYKFISKKAIPYFRDVYDHSIRVADTIDNYREAVGNTFDVYMSTLSNNMNEVMKTLSIIATIALPLSVISGIYGTNFTKLPGAGFLYGFWAMIFVMVLVSIGMLLFFKKRRWF